MRNMVTIRPGMAPMHVPAPPCPPGRIVVRRIHAYVPAALFATMTRDDGWFGRLRRRYPRSLRKAIAYARTEGIRQTWTKVRSRLDLERLGASYAAFAAVGVVERDAGGRFPPGTAVLCWGWYGAVDADLHMVAPEQCLRVPDLHASYALAPMLAWVATLLRTIPGGVKSCQLAGLDRDLLDPLTAIVGPFRESGRDVRVECRSAARGPSSANAFTVSLSASRAVAPLVRPFAHGLVAHLPDASHYFLDALYPGALEWPEPFGRASVEEALSTLVRRAGHEVIEAAPAPASAPEQTVVRSGPARGGRGGVAVSCLGAGNYVRAVLLHHLRRHTVVRVRGVMDVRPEVAAMQGRALDAAFFTTDEMAVIGDRETELVIVASDHASHARYAAAALLAGKAVHLEKPPVVTRADLDRLLAALRAGPAPRLHLGYNRPYAPAASELQKHLDRLPGRTVTTCTVHGYQLSRAHWYRWPNQGTRIAGNLVHWIDLGYRFGGRRAPVWVDVSAEGSSPSREALLLVVGYDDGGTTTVRFSAGGDDTLGIREVITVQKGALSATIDDFSSLTIDAGAVRLRRRYSRDKGHAGNLAALAALVAQPSGDPRTAGDLETVGRIQFAAEAALLAGGGRGVIGS